VARDLVTLDLVVRAGSPMGHGLVEVVAHGEPPEIRLLVTVTIPSPLVGAARSAHSGGRAIRQLFGYN
jgi:hypothetical protein